MKNLIGFWVELARAYEVAKVGNFKLQVVFNKEYHHGFDDYEIIKSFYNDIEFVENGDLIVEIYKPNYNIKTEKFETLDYINKRVQTAIGNIKPTDFKNDSCFILLKSASERLSYSIERREKVIDVAGVIAQMEGTKSIEAHHIAEAIQYNYTYPSYSCNAENRYVNFGNGIKISLHELDSGDIKEAIDYLNNLLL